MCQTLAGTNVSANQLNYGQNWLRAGGPSFTSERHKVSILFTNCKEIDILLIMRMILLRFNMGR